MVNDPVYKGCFDNILRILQVIHIVERIPIAGKFHKGKGPERSFLLACIGNLNLPAFEIFTNGNEVECLAFYSGIFRAYYGICRTMPAFRFIGIEWFSDRLP